MRINEPAGLRCRRCKAPYQVSWSALDQAHATVTVRCPDCGARGLASVNGALAKEVHLQRPGSEGARALMNAVNAACKAANQSLEEG